MRFLYINRDGSLADKLEEDLGEILIRYFVDHKRMTENEAERALEVFDHLKLYDQWLVCSCRKSQQQRPLLGAVEPTVLRRLASRRRDAHDPLCPFTRRQKYGEIIVEPSRENVRDRDLSIFPLFSEAHNGRSRPRDSVQNVRTLPRISNVLFRSLEAAGVNVIRHGQEPETRNNSAEVYRAAKNLPLVHGTPPFPLSKGLVTLTSNDSISKIMMLREQLQKAQGWPVESRPQGYACCVIESVSFDKKRDRYQLLRPGREFPLFVEARPHIFAEGVGRTRRSPFIAIIGYSNPARNESRILGLRCFMQPCLNDNSWFPVDSDFERETLRVLLKWRRELPKSIEIDIGKPLFDREIRGADGHLGRHRPDFVVTVRLSGQPEFEVAIETMGIESVEYAERKKRTHPLMLCDHGLLIQHDLTGGHRIPTTKFLQELDGAVLHRIQPRYQSLEGYL